MKAGSARVAELRNGIRWAFTTAAAVVLDWGTSALAAQELSPLAEEAPMMDGARLGILVLLVITLAMQGAFVGFFLYLRRHAKRNADMELDMEWLELQRGSRRS